VDVPQALSSEHAATIPEDNINDLSLRLRADEFTTIFNPRILSDRPRARNRFTRGAFAHVDV